MFVTLKISWNERSININEWISIYARERIRVCFLLNPSIIPPNTGAKIVLKYLTAPYKPNTKPEFVLVIITQGIIRISILEAKPINKSEIHNFLKFSFLSCPG